MGNPHEPPSNNEIESSNLQIIRCSPFEFDTNAKFSCPWFDLRVFYVRISNFRVDESTPESLTLNHIPLSPDTLLEVNGIRSSVYSDGVSFVLRRNRVDKKFKEATFVSTDSVKTTGSLRFEVFDEVHLTLSGELAMSNGNDFIGESKGNDKQWSMNCKPEIGGGISFLKGNKIISAEFSLPTIEIYVTGCFSGTPIILNKTLQIGFKRKCSGKGSLTIPEHESTELEKSKSPEDELQLAAYKSYKLENEEEYSKMYWRRMEITDGEHGELLWFNAGVSVGVGIGLGICVGIGIGVSLLVRTYQATMRNFRRRLI